METCRRPLFEDVGDGAERVCRALHQDLSREGWVNGVVLTRRGVGREEGARQARQA